MEYYVLLEQTCLQLAGKTIQLTQNTLAFNNDKKRKIGVIQAGHTAHSYTYTQLGHLCTSPFTGKGYGSITTLMKARMLLQSCHSDGWQSYSKASVQLSQIKERKNLEHHLVCYGFGQHSTMLPYSLFSALRFPPATQ